MNLSMENITEVFKYFNISYMFSLTVYLIDKGLSSFKTHTY